KKSFGFEFYLLAEELDHGNAKELQKKDFGREMQKTCHEFWINASNYKKFLNDTSDEAGPETVEPDFFTSEELDYFSKWVARVYDKDNPKHTRAKDHLLETVWSKTVYWSERLAKRLKGFETYNPRMWSQRGWDDSTGENIQVSRFKEYTWARIYKSKDRGRDIFFTVGVEGKEKSLLYKIDFYRTAESDLSPSQRELCKQLIPDDVNWREIPFAKALKYDWDKLLAETEAFIRDNDALYDEIIKSVWDETVQVSGLKNRLIRRETPKRGLKKVPEHQFSFTGYDTDWEKHQRENASIGQLGEELVIEFEKKRLNEGGLNGLAKDVRKVKDGEGYDILSRYENGADKYIEVKSTTGNEDTPFTISLNEMQFSKINPKSYHLYRLFNLKKETRVAEFHEYPRDVAEHFLFEGIQFSAYRKTKES
ncbi:MAG: DUF3883 domain-containing protein, partial [Bacteroidota bacterium]